MLFPLTLSPASLITAVLLSQSLVTCVQGQAPAVSQTLTGFPPCDALISANLSHAVYLPTSPSFPALVDSYFAIRTRRAPWCFVQPSTTAEVSQVVKILRSAGDGAGDWHIAIRSGGHGNAETNNIAQGVTIDLSLLNSTTYDPATNVASFGPGPRWGHVYTELAKHNVLVPGGREGIVGVAGFVLGGGISWYASRAGFTCDSVVNFEVVQASGEIINANASHNSDLWRALKGGSSNFGIVTRFDLEAIPATNLTTEMRSIGIEHFDELADAIAGFANLNRTFQDNAMISMVTYRPDTGNISIALEEINTANDANTTAFDVLNKVPTVAPSKKQSVTLVESVNTTVLPDGSLSSGRVLAIASDSQAIRYAFKEHNGLVESLKTAVGPKNFSTLLDFQPIPAYVADISAERGGNMLGLSSNCSKILVVISATLADPNNMKQLPIVDQLVMAVMQRIVAFSKSIGKDEKFVYLNYADASQNPIGAYGAANIKHIKRVADKYDPKGFFQQRVPGGFKIDRVL